MKKNKISDSSSRLSAFSSEVESQAPKQGDTDTKKTSGLNKVTKDLGYKVSDYITLGTYKGIEVTSDVSTVTDAEVDEVINEYLSIHATTKQIKEGSVKKGDTVNIKFVGKMNGKELDGGTGTNDLTIGSNSFIPGFEDNLIGVKVGETKDLNLTYPEGCAVDLRGKDVVFTVTVNYICGESVIPKLDDAFVTSKTHHKTVEEFKEAMKEKLRQEKNDAVWDLVVLKAKIKKLPDKEVKAAIDDIKKLYHHYSSINGMEYEEILKSMGMTKETVGTVVKPMAEDQATVQLACYAIVEAENITLSNEEYEKRKNSLRKRKGFTDSDKFVEVYGEDFLRRQVLLEKVKEFIVKNAKVVTPSAVTEFPRGIITKMFRNIGTIS